VNDPEKLLSRVRKLLVKAEDESVTPAEAQALTAKAAELMARYGIDRALLAADAPDSDKPANRVLDIGNPWARVKAHLLCGLASALRCQCVLLTNPAPGTRIHIFGYASDLERTDVLYTSVLIQMLHGLAAAEVPGYTSSTRAWRRSWMLGFATAVIARVRAAEYRASQAAAGPEGEPSSRAALVLADRRAVIRRQVQQSYPRLRTARLSYRGSGYTDGFAQGQRADLGGPRLRPRPGKALPGTTRQR
jgi:hypothetical protein